MNLHAIQWRYEAEELVRLRRADEHRRFAAPQRAAKIDPNPHQVDAVIFALSRLADGGCILADEVGLGKTIEAGLVIAQLRAEGARRILLIAPKPLLGQWRQELYTLFGIEARDGVADFDGEGVFLIGREFAGGEKGQAVASAAFDLVVIDEAHEVFGGLYKRMDATGEWRRDVAVARTAWRVFELVRSSGTPVLLLTATPIQNSLAELWALVRYVDPTGTLLGDFRTFRQIFCDNDDRILAEGQEHELRRRIDVVLKRSLRRQAQEFLSKPFVGRQARLFEYRMSPDESRLYEDVTRYLLEPSLAGFRGNNRRLLLIAFHRRMASSSRALAESLERVAARLRRSLEPEGVSAEDDEDSRALLADFDDEEPGELFSTDEDVAKDQDMGARFPPEKIRAELVRVQDFIQRARELGGDSKARALLEALRLVLDRACAGQGSGKMVIFTESLVTQDYLRELFVGSGLVEDAEITLFRGINDSQRAHQALEHWWAQVGDKLSSSTRPSRDIAMRLALIHEFATRSKVFISTEAGAKGLNLQFCETVVNYDLPWNPQRIEQRIGRCHRYGQTRDVTVINFIAQDNETDRLVFEILSQKLELFGTVLDASDKVLHEPGKQQPEVLASALGAEFEASLRRIWEHARTREEIETELRQLREKIGEKRDSFEEAHARTAGLIETHFDEDVRRVFLRRKKELPRALAELDISLERVVVTYLNRVGARYQQEAQGTAKFLRIEPDEMLPHPLQNGISVAIGAVEGKESLHLAHPLVTAAVSAARAAASGVLQVAFSVRRDGAAELRDRCGSRGRLVLLRVRYESLEPVEHLIPIALLEGENEPLSWGASRALLRSPIRDLNSTFVAPAVDSAALEDAIEEALFFEQSKLAKAEQARFDRTLEQIERYVEDRVLLLRRKRTELEQRLEVQRGKRDQALGAIAREEAERAIQRLGQELEEIEHDIERLERRDDATYQRCRDRLHDRRYAPAKVERLFEVKFVLE